MVRETFDSFRMMRREKLHIYRRSETRDVRSCTNCADRMAVELSTNVWNACLEKFRALARVKHHVALSLLSFILTEQYMCSKQLH